MSQLERQQFSNPRNLKTKICANIPFNHNIIFLSKSCQRKANR